MNRLFGASTSVLQTPSPADRKPSHSTSSNQLANITNTTKAVRFSPAQPNQSNYFNPPKLGSPYTGPPSRVQSYGSISTPVRSNSSNSLRQVPVATPPSANTKSDNTQQGQVQHRQSYTPQQQLTPIKARVAHAAATTATVAAHAVDKVKVQRLPLGRGEAAKRLRVNSIMLVGWWIANKTSGYGYAAGMLVQAAPSLDGPLHLVESCVYLLLCYNIAESIYRLQALSGLPEAQAATGLTRRTPSRVNSPSQFATPTRSSPKTRPSPSPVASSVGFGSPNGSHAGSPASPFRASAVGKTTPQTPSSAQRSTSDVLRRSMFDSPGPRSASVGSPLAKTELGGSIGPGYSPKHSALGMSVSINSQEAINRLLDD